MELNSWKPYNFTNLSPTIETYFRHFAFMVARFVFTIEEYRERRIRFTWFRIRWFLFGFTLNMTSVILLYVTARQWNELNYINWCWNRLLQVKSINILFGLLAFIFGGCEYVTLSTVNSLVRHRLTITDLVYDYTRTLDSIFSNYERQFLLRFFNQITFLAGVLRKLCSLAILGLVGTTLVQATVLYSQGYLSFSQWWFYQIFLLCFTFSVYHAMALMFVPLTHVIFLAQICRSKLKRCLGYSKSATVSPHAWINWWLVNRFHDFYLPLYKEIQILNSSSFKDYWLVMDLIIKFSWTLCLIWYTKQAQLSLFSYLILFNFLIIFLDFEFIYFYFSDIPSKNRQCYINLTNWYAKRQFFVLKQRKEWNQIRMSKRNLRAERLVQNVSENRLGFSSGNLYLITRFKFIEMILINGVFLALFYKRVSL